MSVNSFRATNSKAAIMMNELGIIRRIFICDKGNF